MARTEILGTKVDKELFEQITISAKLNKMTNSTFLYNLLQRVDLESGEVASIYNDVMLGKIAKKKMAKLAPYHGQLRKIASLLDLYIRHQGKDFSKLQAAKRDIVKLIEELE